MTALNPGHSARESSALTTRLPSNVADRYNRHLCPRRNADVGESPRDIENSSSEREKKSLALSSVRSGCFLVSVES